MVTGLLKEVSVRRPDHPQTDDEDVHGSCRCCLGCHDREPVALRFQCLVLKVRSGLVPQDPAHAVLGVLGQDQGGPSQEGRQIRLVKSGFWCDSNRRGCH